MPDFEISEENVRFKIIENGGVNYALRHLCVCIRCYN